MQLPFVLLQVLLLLFSTATFAFSRSGNSGMASSSSSSCPLSQSSSVPEDSRDGKVVIKCAPCASMDPSSLLSADQVQERLASSCLPLWKLVTLVQLGNDTPSTTNDDTTANNKIGSLRISRKFMARNFQAALDAMNAFGAMAEEQGHHPDLMLTNYRQVEIQLWTHKVQGVTENDLLLAALFDEKVKIDYSPAWLKQHPHAKGTAK
jgi:pterin-4a-carbinolamine dehydratase